MPPLHSGDVTCGRAYVQRTTSRSSGAGDHTGGGLGMPPTREEESKWLGNFLRIRAQIMYDDANTWRENMYRVANYEKLRLAGNFDLTGCIRTGASSAATWPGSGFTSDSGPVANLGQCP